MYSLPGINQRSDIERHQKVPEGERKPISQCPQCPRQVLVLLDQTQLLFLPHPLGRGILVAQVYASGFIFVSITEKAIDTITFDSFLFPDGR